MRLASPLKTGKENKMNTQNFLQVLSQVDIEKTWEGEISDNQVHAIWAHVEKVRKGFITMLRDKLQGKQPPLYFAVNFVSIIPSKGGISKCEFMKKSYKMGYIKKRFGMEKTHYVVDITSDKEDESPFVMSRVNMAIAKYLKAQTSCWVEGEEILT